MNISKSGNYTNLCTGSENLFCQIDTDSFNVHDDRSAQVVRIYRPTVAQDIGGDHFINKSM
ncbi:hypothetical protein B6E78_02385 [Edwardsiella ictaluri]|nr:hypothetical protein B6E78_02385 [Edwardsiella ictaluri]